MMRRSRSSFSVAFVLACVWFGPMSSSADEPITLEEARELIMGGYARYAPSSRTYHAKVRLVARRSTTVGAFLRNGTRDEAEIAARADKDNVIHFRNVNEIEAWGVVGALLLRTDQMAVSHELEEPDPRDQPEPLVLGGRRALRLEEARYDYSPTSTGMGRRRLAIRGPAPLGHFWDAGILDIQATYRIAGFTPSRFLDDLAKNAQTGLARDTWRVRESGDIVYARRGGSGASVFSEEIVFSASAGLLLTSRVSRFTNQIQSESVEWAERVLGGRAFFVPAAVSESQTSLVNGAERIIFEHKFEFTELEFDVPLAPEKFTLHDFDMPKGLGVRDYRETPTAYYTLADAGLIEPAAARGGEPRDPEEEALRLERLRGLLAQAGLAAKGRPRAPRRRVGESGEPGLGPVDLTSGAASSPPWGLYLFTAVLAAAGAVFLRRR